MRVTREMYESYISKNADKLRVKTYTNQEINYTITEHFENVKLGQKTAERVDDNGVITYDLYTFRCG